MTEHRRTTHDLGTFFYLVLEVTILEFPKSIELSGVRQRSEVMKDGSVFSFVVLLSIVGAKGFTKNGTQLN